MWLNSDDHNQYGTVCIVIDGSQRTFIPIHRPLKPLKSDETSEILLAKIRSEPISVTITFETIRRAQFGTKFIIKFETIK